MKSEHTISQDKTIVPQATFLTTTRNQTIIDYKYF